MLVATAGMEKTPLHDDMCIRHQEWREYTPPGSQSKSRFANIYYHFNPLCVWLRCSWFVPYSLEIPADLPSQLNELQRATAQSVFH